ncbi:uncharacterized protein TNCV_46891 [Trichonephila clavipes]|nr:uncharacterized protein TNCV_46891 [Trichonephila clavipes]
MSWKYCWAVMVPGINTRSDRVLQAMAPHAITQLWERRPGSIPRQSSFLVRGTTPNGSVDGGVKGSTRNGHRYPKYPSPRRLRIVRENTEATSKGAACAWIAADRPPHFLRCGGLLDDWSVEDVPEPGLRVNDIYRIHWSQHLLTTT